MNKIETPFDPFKKEEGKIELKFNFRTTGSHIVQEVSKLMGNKLFQILGLPTEFHDKSFYLEAIYYEKLQNALFPFPKLSSDARNLISLFSLLPRFYKESFKQKAYDFFVEQNILFSSLTKQQDFDLNRGNDSDVRFSQTRNTEQASMRGKHFSKLWGLQPDGLKLFTALKKITERRAKEKGTDPNKEFLKGLKLLSSISESWKKRLPSESVIRDLIIFELDRIIRLEGLFPDIDESTRTNTKITELIISLFQAVGYFEVDTAQDQLRMVNNAFHRYKDIFTIR